MLLLKRSWSSQKDQNMGEQASDVLNSLRKELKRSYISLPDLIAGCNRNRSADSVRSPTSPLDFKVFSSNRKAWDGSKVGLGMVESLAHEEVEEPKKILRASDSLIWDGMFHTGEASFGSFHPSSLDSASRFANLASWNFGLRTDKDHSGGAESSASAAGGGIIGTIPHDIEHSEEYTCVISHGPNPKVTHIFRDRVLESHSIESDKNNKDVPVLDHAVEGNKAPQVASPYFLSCCYFCKKKLDGIDIYMYRGDIAFCSSICRLQQILLDEKNGSGIGENKERD